MITSKVNPIIIYSILAGVIGFYLGRLTLHEIFNRPQPLSRVDLRENHEQLSSLEKERDILRKEIRELKQSPLVTSTGSSQRSRPDSSAPSGAALRSLRDLLDLKKQQFASIRMPVVTKDGRLTPGFIKLFGVTQEENDTLEAALAHARKDIEEKSLANATISHGEGSVRIVVQPFDGGSDVYDHIMTAFEKTLGAERYGLMIGLHTDELSRAFSGFGAERRTLIITREATAVAGETSFKLSDSRKVASGSIYSQAQFSNIARIPDAYRWVERLVPNLSTLPVQAHAPTAVPSQPRF